jgi:UMF1 family MFS transporter
MRTLFKNPDLKRFFLAYLFYEDGINTVIVFSSIYAANTLGFAPSEIVLVYLAIQASAMVGGFVISKYVEGIGYKKTLRLSVFAWVLITALASIIFDKWHFVLLSVSGGTFLGIVQASSRALFATFIPPGEESKYFGLYGLVGKSSAILGPTVFGLISYSTRSERMAVIFVSILFLLGFLVLGGLKEKIVLNSSSHLC